jgi:hypothetical protein
VRGWPAAALETVIDRGLELRGALRGGQRDHAAAEAAAGHPGSAGPGGLDRLDGLDRFDGLVGLRPGPAEVAAHRVVRFGEQGAEGFGVAGVEVGDRFLQPLVFGQDVAGDPAQGRIAEAFQLVLIVDVSQRGDAQRAGGLLASASLPGVAAVGERAARPGVDDQQGQASRGRIERDRRGGPVAAVQEQRVTGPAVQRRDLVHDPARHADELLLGPVGQGGELGLRQVMAVEFGQGEGGGAFQRGRGGQPRAGRQVGIDRDAGAGQVAQPRADPGSRASRSSRMGSPACCLETSARRRSARRAAVTVTP